MKGRFELTISFTRLMRVILVVTSPSIGSVFPLTPFHIVVFLRATDGSRTHNLNLGKVVLYQLSYYRIYSDWSGLS